MRDRSSCSMDPGEQNAHYLGSAKAESRADAISLTWRGRLGTLSETPYTLWHRKTPRLCSPRTPTPATVALNPRVFSNRGKTRCSTNGVCATHLPVNQKNQPPGVSCLIHQVPLLPGIRDMGTLVGARLDSALGQSSGTPPKAQGHQQAEDERAAVLLPVKSLGVNTLQLAIFYASLRQVHRPSLYLK